MAFHGAYHGMTAGALAVSGNLTPKSAGGNGRDVHFLPYPYAFRCPFGTDGSATDQLSINYIRTVLSDPERDHQTGGDHRRSRARRRGCIPLPTPG